MKLTIDISNCSECFYSATNSSLHDDPFTSTPLTHYYKCLAKGGPDFIWYEDARKEVHPKCPKKEK